MQHPAGATWLGSSHQHMSMPPHLEAILVNPLHQSSIYLERRIVGIMDVCRLLQGLLRLLPLPLCNDEGILLLFHLLSIGCGRSWDGLTICIRFRR